MDEPGTTARADRLSDALKRGIDIIGATVGLSVLSPLMLVIALLIRALGRPWVFDHHDLCPEVYASRVGTPNPWVTRILATFEWLTLRTATEGVVLFRGA